jgi:hypothetical protein
MKTWLLVAGCSAVQAFVFDLRLILREEAGKATEEHLYDSQERPNEL